MAGTEDEWLGDAFMEKVLAIAPTIIYLFNQETQSNEYSNRSLGEMLGYEPEEIQAMGEAMMPTLAHPEDLPKIGAHFAAMQDLAEGDVSEILYRMRHKDGRWVWLLSHESVFERNEHGGVRRHVGVAADVTARIESQAEVTRTNDRLLAANQELAELAYVVSHDMRAPIVNIAQLARAIEANLPAEDEDSRGMVDLILQSCGQAEKRIEAVVRVAQNSESLGAGGTAHTALATAVQAATEELAPMIASTGATVDARVRADLLVGVPELPLHTVLVNLFTNAIGYRHPLRPPTIRVDAETHDEVVAVTIADNGVGIAEHDRERIFDLFQRGTEAHGDGSGLGLYLVRQMVRRSGGDVSIDANPDGGTVFTLSFPLVRDA